MNQKKKNFQFHFLSGIAPFPGENFPKEPKAFSLHGSFHYIFFYLICHSNFQKFPHKL